MLSIVEKGNVEKASRNFLNLLAFPDTVIFDKEKGLGNANIILGASAFGIVCWPATPVVRENQRSFQLLMGPGDKHKLITIDNVDQYLCQGTKVLAPAANKDVNESGRPKGIRIAKDDTTACGCLLHRCKHGLPLLKVADMQYCVNEMKVPVDRMPAAEIEYVKKIIKVLCHGISDEDLALYCGRHGIAKKRNIVFGSVLADFHVSDVVDDVMPHDLKEELDAATKEYAEAVEAMQITALPKAKAGAKAKKKRKYAEKKEDVLFMFFFWSLRKNFSRRSSDAR